MSDNNENMEPFDGIKDSHKNPPAHFNILFYGLIIWGIAFCAYFLTSGWSSHNEFQEKMTAHEQKYSGNSSSGSGY